MIAKILAQHFKGIEKIQQPLSRLNLLVGVNGAGKSARSQALQIATLGYTLGTGKPEKKNADILDTYGDGQKLFVGFELGDRTQLLKRYVRNPDGSVSCDHMLNRKKCNEKQYAAASAGVKVFDLRAFMEQSDRRKIDTIFALFSPSGDVSDLDTKIDAAKGKISLLEGKIRMLKGTDKMPGTIGRLESERRDIQLPAGTLAECTGEIERIEKQLAEARASLKAAEIEQARAEEADKVFVQHQAELQQVREEAQVVEQMPVSDFKPVDDPVPTIGPAEQATLRELVNMGSETQGHLTAVFPPKSPGDPVFAFSLSVNAEESIRAILETMKRTGCTACAAMLRAKKELKRFQKGAAA